VKTCDYNKEAKCRPASEQIEEKEFDIRRADHQNAQPRTSENTAKSQFILATLHSVTE